jgi:hypothetical protein
MRVVDMEVCGCDYHKKKGGGAHDAILRSVQVVCTGALETLQSFMKSSVK